MEAVQLNPMTGDMWIPENVEFDGDVFEYANKVDSVQFNWSKPPR